MDYLEEPAGKGRGGANMSEAPDATGARETYSWAGTDRHGVAHTGRTGLPLADIARITENYYRQGWQSLRVARGWDMPAADGELVAAIEPSPDAGRRTWWSEVPEHQAEAGSSWSARHLLTGRIEALAEIFGPDHAQVIAWRGLDAGQ